MVDSKAWLMLVLRKKIGGLKVFAGVEQGPGGCSNNAQVVVVDFFFFFWVGGFGSWSDSTLVASVDKARKGTDAVGLVCVCVSRATFRGRWIHRGDGCCDTDS